MEDLQKHKILFAQSLVAVTTTYFKKDAFCLVILHS